MGKGLDKFLNIMRLNDDDYDDEYEDDYEDEYEEDYDDEYDDDNIEPVSRKKTSFRKSTASASESVSERERPIAAAHQTSAAASSRAASAAPVRNSKIVPMKQPSQRSRGMEVSIQKPAAFEDSRDICDVLLNGKAAIVNLEGIDVDVAQRIIDFVSGACYSMSGNIRKVSGYIFIVTPEGIDISGDIENVLSSNSSASVPAFHLNV